MNNAKNHLSRRLVSLFLAIMLVVGLCTSGIGTFNAVSTDTAATGDGQYVYKLVDSITAGNDYLIVSSNAAGSAYALKNEGGSSDGTAMASAGVEITSSDVDNDGTADLVISDADASIVWSATANGDGFNLSNGTDYLEGYSSSVFVFDSQQYSSRYWTYADKQLQYNGKKTFTVYYSDGFTATTDESSEVIYAYEKTPVGGTVIEPTAAPTTAPTDAPITGNYIFKLVDEVTIGKEYLIVNTNTAGDAYALKNNGGTEGGTALDKSSVEIESADLDNDGSNDLYIASAEDNTVWTTTANGDGFDLTNNGDYIEGSGGSFKIYNPQQNAERYWTSANNNLIFHGSRNYYLYYSSRSGFGYSGSARDIYVFEKTAFDGDLPTVAPTEPPTEAPTFEPITGNYVYKLVDTVTANKEYLIVNANTEGSAFALKNDGGTSGGTSLNSTKVSIVSVDVDNDGTAETVIDCKDADICWSAAAHNDGFKLINGTDYLECKSNSIKIYTEVQYADREWTYTNSQFRFTGSNTTTTYTLYYSGSNFTHSTTTSTSSSRSLYAFEKVAVPEEFVVPTAAPTEPPTEAPTEPPTEAPTEGPTVVVEGNYVYKLVDTVTPGKLYMIANTNEAGSAYALKSNGGSSSGTAMGAASVTIKSADIDNDNTDDLFIASTDATTAWQTREYVGGFVLTNGTDYLDGYHGNVYVFDKMQYDDGRYWIYADNQLQYKGSSNNYRVYFDGTKFTSSTSSSEPVYFFEQVAVSDDFVVPTDAPTEAPAPTDPPTEAQTEPPTELPTEGPVEEITGNYVYKLVDAVTAGKTYLIVNTDEEGDAYALKNDGGTSGGTSLNSADVTVKSADIDNDGTADKYIASEEADIAWAARAYNSGFSLSNNANYLEGKGGNLRIFDKINYTDRYWTYENSQLDYINPKTGTSGSNAVNYTLYYNNGFTQATGSNSNKIYVYEKTAVAEMPTDAPFPGAYFLVGSFNNWTPSEEYMLTKNEAADTEEYMISADLTTTSMFKVVFSDDGETVTTWYPDGEGNNYGQNGEITADGLYDIYFRPNGDGPEDWFYNVIYVAMNTPVPTEGPTETVEGNYVYKLVDTVTPGREYLIVSANKAGDAYALKNNGGSANGTSLARASVEILSDGEDLIIATTETDIAWQSRAYLDGFTLKNGTDSLERISGGSGILIYDEMQNADGYWTYADSQLGYINPGHSTYYVYYSSRGSFNSSSTGRSVYVYEKTAYEGELPTEPPTEPAPTEGETIAPVEGDYVYKLVDTVTPGKLYMIANTNEAGDAYALKSNGGSSSGTAMDAASVAIQSADIDNDGTDDLFIASTDATTAWQTREYVGGFVLTNGTDYLDGYHGNVYVFDKMQYDDGRYWIYADNQLQYKGSTNNYRVYFDGTMFTSSTSSSEPVYFFEQVAYTPAPTEAPTDAPVPTEAPTDAPVPTEAPTDAPVPTEAPTDAPVPTEAPTDAPVPTEAPTDAPEPTEAPTEAPQPTEAPTEAPTEDPTAIKFNTYYLTGTIANWGIDTQYELTDLGDGLYCYEGLKMTPSTLVKAVKTGKRSIEIANWYPDGMDNNQGVTENGIYTVYFRPNGDGTAEDGYTYVPYEGDGTGLDAHGCLHGGYLFKFVKTDDYTPTEAPTVAPDQTMTVYFTDTMGWGNINAYYWGSAASSVDWPGEAAEQIGDNLWKAILPNDITGLIFNSAGNGQTVNIEEGLVDKAAWATTGEFDDSNNYYVTPVDAPETTMVVYFVDVLGWGNINAYYWGSSNGSTDWPGEAATVVDTIVDTDGHTVYGVVVPNDITGLIFNSNTGSPQTVNIETGLVDGGVWRTTGEQEGNNYVVAEGVCPEVPTEPATEPGTTILLGDVNDDEEVGVKDATFIQRYDAGFTTPISEEDILLRGDVNGDEEASVMDATFIQRYDAGFNVPYPIGEYVVR